MDDKTIGLRSKCFDSDGGDVHKVCVCSDSNEISLFFASTPNVDAVKLGKAILLKSLFEQRRQNNCFDNTKG